MAENKKAKSQSPKLPDVELDPDAWPRFERFIKAAAKAGPQHREAKAKPTKKRGLSKPSPRPTSR